ncbi:MAG: hypothetical protein A3E84_00540 [Gammaproteobacteria bacterium RIFCSPHIGHO2_12_FULL_42_13]|nr:MAG: hypothetical protein A3E84_00540 [Gammaproteobacteria bacterium RIFCSPHIGHO2_12_FULL_42_13]
MSDFLDMSDPRTITLMGAFGVFFVGAVVSCISRVCFGNANRRGGDDERTESLLPDDTTTRTPPPEVVVEHSSSAGRKSLTRKEGGDAEELRDSQPRGGYGATGGR